MDQFTKFLFSENEKVLLSCLDSDGKRPRNLLREAKIPHASLYLAFEKLSARGFAVRYVKRGRIFWKKAQNIDADVLSKESDTKVFIHTDKDSVKKSILQILKLTSGSRVIIVEGTQSDSGWFDLFSKAETMELNKTLSNKKIICESILPESYFKDAIPRLGRDWALSYRTRPIVTYVVNKNLISSNALLIALKNKIIIFYAKEVLSIEILNENIVSLFQGMLEVVKSSARRVSVNDDLSFEYLRS